MIRGYGERKWNRDRDTERKREREKDRKRDLENQLSRRKGLDGTRASFRAQRHDRSRVPCPFLIRVLRLQRRDSAVWRCVRPLTVAQPSHSRLRGEPGGRLRGRGRGHRGMCQTVMPSGFGHQVRRTTRDWRQDRIGRPRVKGRGAGRAWHAPRVWQRVRQIGQRVMGGNGDAHRQAVPG